MTRDDVIQIMNRECPYLEISKGYSNVWVYYDNQPIMLFNEDEIDFPYHIGVSRDGKIRSYDKHLNAWSGKNFVVFYNFMMSQDNIIEERIRILNLWFKKAIIQQKKFNIIKDFQ